MSNLSQRIQAAAPAPHSPTFNEWLISLDAQDREAVDKMFADPAWSIRKIHSFLRAERVRVSDNTIMVRVQDARR